MDNIVTVYDNFISDDLHCNIVNEMCQESSFAWFLNRCIVNDLDMLDTKKIQFTHHFYREDTAWTDSEFKFLIDPILENIKPNQIFRIKANLLPATDNIERSRLHVDVDYNCKTAIFYVNSNNGYTFFEDSTKINSVANRLVMFNSTILHAGTTCTDSKCRVVINFNYS